MAGVQQEMAARSLARDLTGELAPEEVDLFDELARPPDRRGTDDDPLAFGAGELVVALTPILLRIAEAVLGYLAAKAPELGYDLATDLLKDRLKDWLAARKPVLPDRTLDLLRVGVAGVVEAEVLRHGLDRDQATAIAVAVEKRLGLATG